MALALALAGAAACSYIVELPTSDVSIPLPDASSDGAPDVALPESDANPFEPSAPFCASTTTPSLFCADFDGSPTPDLTTLGTVQTTTGSVLEIANAISLSPPRSLLSNVSGPDGSSRLVHTLGASPDALTVSSSLLLSTWKTTDARFTRIELRPADAGADSFCMVRLMAATTWFVTQVCFKSGVEVANRAAESGQLVELGKWHRFSLGVKLTAPKTVMLDIDGTRVVDVAALEEMQPSPATVAFGVERATSGQVVLFQDNLLVTSP